MILIVGLGNPEKKYDNTYHNVGFRCVDALAEKVGAKFSKTQCQAVVGEFFLNNKKVVIAKPTTYMNLSGNSVVAFKSKFKVSNQNIIVVSDDIDLPLGTYRYKTSGSGGTHNGLRSIVSSIGSDFKRMRIGIGKPDDIDLADWVLSKISAKNQEIIDEVIEEITEFILDRIEEIDD